jgi:general secretion pathway protein M
VKFQGADRALLLRRLRFVALNASAALLFVGFVVVPFVSHVESLCEDLSERSEQLVTLRQFEQTARQHHERLDALFLSASEERLASADLHALLRTLTQEGGLQLLGLRSVSPRQPIAGRSIAVGLEVEGPPAKLRDTLLKIETARPILVVTGLTLRPSSKDNDAVLGADLVIQGALRPPPAVAGLAEPGG